MDRKPLNSFWLVSSGYDPDSKTMHLEIKDSRKGKDGQTVNRHQIVMYEGVPKETHDGLRAEHDRVEAGTAGASVGNYFHRAIKPFHVGRPLAKQEQPDGSVSWKDLQTGKVVIQK